MDAIESGDVVRVSQIQESDPWRQRELCEAAARVDFFEALLVFRRKGFQWDQRTYDAATESTRSWLTREGCPSRRETARTLDALTCVVRERFKDDADKNTRDFLLEEIESLRDTHNYLKSVWFKRNREKEVAVAFAVAIVVAVTVVLYAYFICMA